MKKTVFILPLLAVAFAATPVFAATITVTPTTVTVAPGDTIIVTLGVDPSGATLSVVEAKLVYTDALLTPTAFTFAPTWIPVTQTGYDQMGGGTLTKTGGYPGGIASSTVFGTVTFTAKAAGTATVAVQNSSMAYDGSSKNVLAGTQGTSAITIAVRSTGGPTGTSATTTAAASPAPAVVPGSSVSAAPRPVSASLTAASRPSAVAVSAQDSGTGSVAATASSSQTGNTLFNNQTAAVANAASAAGFFDSLWSWLLMLLLLVLVAGGLWFYSNRQQN